MLSGTRKISWHAFNTPVIWVLAGLALIFTLVFLFGFRYANVTSRLLPAAAFSILLLLLLVPQKNISMLITSAMVVSIPFAHFAAFVVFGEGVQWSHIFGLVLIVHLVVRMLLGEKFPIAPSTPWVFMLWGATLLSVIGILNEPEEHVLEFFKSHIQLVIVFLLYLAVTHLKLSGKNILLLVKLMLIISVLVSLFAIYQLPARFFNLPLSVIRLTNPSLSGEFHVITLIHQMTRASSIFSEPSYLGHYLVGMLALSLTAAFHRPKLLGSRFTLWLVIGLQATALVLSFAMSSFYIFAQLILVMFIVEGRTVKGKISWIVLTFLVLGIAAMTVIEKISGYPITQQLLDRIYGIIMFIGGDEGYMIAGESAFMRVDTARIAMEVWKDHPIFGVGLGSYTLISSRYGEWNPFGWAANTLVNTLAETGIIGFIALMGVGVSNLTGLWRVFHYKGPKTADNNSTSDLKDLTLAARMVFYLVLVVFLYFHVLGSFYWPNTWLYLGLGGLITIRAASAIQNERKKYKTE